MNLQELEISKQLKKEKYTHNLTGILNQYGWKVKGTGVEAVVAAHPRKPYVLKIYESASVYSDFVHLVQKNPNKHFPRFSRFVRTIPGAPQFNYVRMEILDKVTDIDLKREFLPYLCAIEQITKKAEKKNPDLYWNLTLGGWQRTVSKRYDDIDECSQQSPASWRKAVSLVVNAMPALGLTQLDLHFDNMMKRGPDLVITDPWYKD